MNNLPAVKIGIVVGSTDWMPSDLAIEKRKALIEKYVSSYGEENIYEAQICLDDNEINIKRVMKELSKAECNALCIYWANYGPESSGTLLAREFNGPVMLIGAKEESVDQMQRDRTDSLSGLINACFALDIRNTNAYIPPSPIGTVNECADMIHDFVDIARTYLATKMLKIISVGPRPSSYMASEVSLKPLYNAGISIDECSELEIFDSYNKHAEDSRIAKVEDEILSEMGLNESTDVIRKFAQYEVTVNDWIRGHKGNSKYVTMTSTCWPAFPVNFGFVPCYINSRLTAKGTPVACEVDVYGALSEYVGQAISDDIVTILNINNNLPEDIYESQIGNRGFNGKKYELTDTILGYHCGVTCSQKLENAELKPHFVNNELIGEEKSQGTIHGRIKSGEVTLLRIQPASDSKMKAYVLQGQILPVDASTYGGYGVIAIPQMERFVRNVVMEKHFPNHAAVIWGHHAEKLYGFLHMMGIDEIYYNQPKEMLYEKENAFHGLKDWY